MSMPLSTPLTAPRDNFPLPRELRDEIYGYLLDAPQVANDSQIRRDNDYNANQHRRDNKSLPPSPPPFSTALLRVNKTIGREAREMLYKRNTFITISTQTRVFLDAMEAHEYPIVGVTRAQLSHFEHSSMHINLRQEQADWTMEEHFIMFLRDLPDFCLILRWFFYSLCPAPDSSAYERFPEQWGGPDLITDFTITLQQSEYRPQTAQRDETLLEHFRDCISDNAKFTNRDAVCEQAFVATLISRLSAKRSSEPAMTWHILDALIKLMSRSEEAYRHGNLDLALEILMLVAATQGAIACRTESQLDWNDPCGGDKTTRRLELVFMDSMARLQYLNLKEHHHPANRCKELRGSCLYPRSDDYAGLVTSLSGEPLYLEGERLRIVLSMLDPIEEHPSNMTIAWGIEEMKGLHLAVPTYEPLRRDLEALEMLAAEGKTVIDQESDKQKFVAQLLMPTIENAPHSAYDFVVPASMQGWVDTSEKLDGDEE